jgi:hypothetical protein
MPEFEKVGKLLSDNNIPVVYGVVPNQNKYLDLFDRRNTVPIQPWGPIRTAYPEDHYYSIPVDGLRENDDKSLNVDIDDVSGATALGCSLAAVVLYLGRLWPDRSRGPINWELARHGLDALRNYDSSSSLGKRVDVSLISEWIERNHEADKVDRIYERLYETLYGSRTRAV